MASVFHSLCISATLLATAAPSHAAISHQLSAQERGFARLLSWFAERTNYQPTYGFSSSSSGYSGSSLVNLVGGQSSVDTGGLTHAGAGTLTLGTSGFTDSLGSLQLNNTDSGSLSLSAGYLSTSGSSAIAWLRTLPDDRWSGLESTGGRLIISGGTLNLSPSEFERLRSRSNTFLTNYHYDPSTGSLTLVPEPSALLLGGLGSLALLRRRRAA